jgi:hypothetical protein
MEAARVMDVQVQRGPAGGPRPVHPLGTVVFHHPIGAGSRAILVVVTDDGADDV